MHPSTSTKTKEEKEHDKRLRALKTAGWFDRMNPFRDKSKDIKNAQSTRVTTAENKDEQIFEPGKTNSIESINVMDSTAIQDARYNEKTGNMSIRFRGGTKDYTFPEVPEEVAEGFQHAASKGRYYNQNIKQYSINQ